MNYLNNPPKNLLPLFLMDILQRKTDEDHRLNQEEIIRILEDEYQMKANRKTIRRTFEYLTDLNIGIQHEVTKKNTPQLERNEQSGKMEKVLDKDGKPVMMEIENWDNYYLIRDFEKSEIRLLIDSLLFSGLMPKKQCIDLAEKLAALAGPFFGKEMKYIHSLQDSDLSNRQMSLNIELLNEAIEEGKLVAFYMNRRGTNRKLQHARRSAWREPEKMVFKPVQTIMQKGRYYVIGKTLEWQPKDFKRNYRLGESVPMEERKYRWGKRYLRIDLMSEMEVLGEKVEIEGAKIPNVDISERFDLASYVDDHDLDDGRRKSFVQFTISNPSIIDTVIRELGNNLTFNVIEEGPWKKILVSGRASWKKTEMLARWNPYVVLEKPEYLVRRMRQYAERLSGIYESAEITEEES